MGRTTIDQSKNKYVVFNKLDSHEVINERELEAIAGGIVESLIPIKTETSKKGSIIKTSVVDMMTLHSYFSGIVSKKMFLDVLVQLTALMKECEMNLMNVNNLMLDWDAIFLEPRTKKVKCILWPIVNNQNPIVLTEFFKEIPFRIVFNKHEDLDYVSQYLRYFKSNTPFSIHSFEELIFQLMEKRVENSYTPPKSTNTDNQSKEVVSIPENAPDQNKHACSKCGGVPPELRRFCPTCGTPLEKAGTASFNETVVLDAGTTVLSADGTAEPTFPYLLREATQEKINVDKPVFRIGKERRYCDYFIANNHAISRSHADIITKDTRFYIIDNNSTNKTFVDGRVIPVQKEIEIFSGTKLRLANENFEFYI